MTAANLVPRETIKDPKVRPLLFRKYLREANAQGLKDTTRRIITAENAVLGSGEFSNLRLETGRGTKMGELRCQCEFPGGRVRVVSVLPLIRRGDLFWVKDGRFGSRAKSSQTIQVLEVRAARVQDLSDADAIAEGVELLPAKFKKHAASQRVWFSRLWDDINGAGNWASNPWVWVYRYRVIPLNIDKYIERRTRYVEAFENPAQD